MSYVKGSQTFFQPVILHFNSCYPGYLDHGCMVQEPEPGVFHRLDLAAEKHVKSPQTRDLLPEVDLSGTMIFSFSPHWA